MSLKTPLKNKTILITAGPTREAMDPVRFLTNPSSGATGIEIAKAFQRVGASVQLVLGPTHLSSPSHVTTFRVTSTLDMNVCVKKLLPKADVFVASAAVGDWRFQNVRRQKMKKEGSSSLTVTMVRNPDILAEAGAWKRKKRSGLILIGFALETKNHVAEAVKKLEKKNLDLIIANSPETFSSGKIRSCWVDRFRRVMIKPRMSKSQFAKELVGWVNRYGC